MTVATHRSLAIGLTAVIVLVAVVACFVPAGLGWDFANFYDTGRKAFVWQMADLYDPTTLIAGESPQSGMPFWGTPLSALLYAPLGALPPKAALTVFKLAGTAAFLGAILLLYRENRRLVEPTESAHWRFTALFALAVLIFQPFWSVYRVGGQSTPFIFLLMTAGMTQFIRGRVWLTALCVVCAVSIKPNLVFALAAICYFGGWPMVRACAVSGGALAVASIGLIGWPVHQTFLGVMRKGFAVSFDWPFNSSLYAAVDALKLAEPARNYVPLDVVVILLKLAVLGVFVRLAMQLRKQPMEPSARRHAEYLVALAFFLCMSHTVFEHYLAILFPLLIYVIAAAPQFTRQALTSIGVVLLLTVLQNATFTVPFARMLGELSWPTIVALALLKGAPLWVTLFFLIRHGDALMRSFAAGASKPAHAA